jgi:hypothetical protein
MTKQERGYIILAILLALLASCFVLSSRSLTKFSDLSKVTGTLKSVEKVVITKSSTMMVVTLREQPEGMEYFYDLNWSPIIPLLHEGQTITIWSEEGPGHHLSIENIHRKFIWQLSVNSEVVLPYSKAFSESKQDNQLLLRPSITFYIISFLLVCRMMWLKKKEKDRLTVSN